MIIDIVSIPSDKYSNLSHKNMAKLRAAQVKKNAVVAEAQKKINSMFDRMSARHFVQSTAYELYVKDVNAQVDQAIADIIDELDFQLAEDSDNGKGNQYGPYRYPENPNYDLSDSERFLAVENYYMSATKDPNARLQAYSMDALAREYLGQYYQTLYDLLASYCT